MSLTRAHDGGLNASAPSAHIFTTRAVDASEGWQTQAEVGLVATGDPDSWEALITYNIYGTHLQFGRIVALHYTVFIHFIPDSLRESAPLFLKRPCDLTLGGSLDIRREHCVLYADELGRR